MFSLLFQLFSLTLQLPLMVFGLKYLGLNTLEAILSVAVFMFLGTTIEFAKKE